MSKPNPKHSFVLRVISRRGCRVEYQLVFNETTLIGKVVRTRSKGQIRWTTHFKNQSVDRYDPQWLCRRNSRIVKVPNDHPSMWDVPAEAEAA